MDTSAAAQLRNLTPMIAADWEFRLRNESPLTPLGRQATVSCLIGTTLAQVAHALGSDAGRRTALEIPPPIARVHAHFLCGRDPLRRYFAAGEDALRAIAGTARNTDLDSILRVFRLIAQRETDAPCDDCRRDDGPDCPRPPRP